MNVDIVAKWDAYGYIARATPWEPEFREYTTTRHHGSVRQAVDEVAKSITGSDKNRLTKMTPKWFKLTIPGV